MHAPSARPFHARRFLTNYAVLAAGEFSTKILTLLAFSVMARSLGPASFGVAEFALAVAFFASLIVDFGFGLNGARELAHAPEQRSSITRAVTANRLHFSMVAVCGVLLFAMTPLVPAGAAVPMVILTGSLLASALALPWVFQGLDRMVEYALTQTTRFGTFSLVVLVGVRTPDQVWLVAVAEAAGVIAAVVASFLLYRRAFGTWPPIAVSTGRDFLRRAAPIGLSQIMWASKYVFVTILLGMLVAPPRLAQFAAALRLVVALHAFVTLYFYNLLPSVSRCWRAGPAALCQLLAISVRGSAWLALLLAGGGVIGSELVVRVIYGPSYAPATRTLQILFCALAAAALSATYRVTLIAAGRQGFEMVAMGVGAAAQVIVMLLLLARSGVEGAAWGMLVGETLTLALAIWWVERRVAQVGSGALLIGPLLTLLPLALVVILLTGRPLWLQVGAVTSVIAVGVGLFDRAIVLAGARRICAGWARHDVAEAEHRLSPYD